VINTDMEKGLLFGSGEYSPTPTHALPAFVGGKPTGYVCLQCGYLVKDLDPIFDDLCLVCLKDWATKMGVSRLITVQEAIERDALEPTVPINKPKAEATTVIMNMNLPSKSKTKNLEDGSVYIDRNIPALEKIKKDI
jgi:hypothetical protein